MTTKTKPYDHRAPENADVEFNAVQRQILHDLRYPLLMPSKRTPEGDSKDAGEALDMIVSLLSRRFGWPEQDIGKVLSDYVKRRNAARKST